MWGDRTNTLQLYVVFYFACSSYTQRAHSGLGEVVQTLNNVSLLEHLGVKTQCEISEKKHVHSLFILLPISLTCFQMKEKGSLLLLPPADIHCCIPFSTSFTLTPLKLWHISWMRWALMNGGQSRVEGDACQVQASWVTCSWESNSHADTQLVVMLSFFFPFNERVISVSLWGWVCVCADACGEEML